MAEEESSDTAWDWSQAYKRWEKFGAGEENENEQPRDFEEILKAEAEKAAGPDGMGHYHDHTEERIFFEKPEDEKMRFCELERMYGNYTYDEGMLPKAVEHYKLALAYYEYCFPETEEKQKQLDELKNACLCNVSLCYYRLGEMRKAISSASQVLNKNPRYVKALFRRARAYRELDEYDNAFEDIDTAIECSPNDASLKKERIRLIKQKQASKTNVKHMAEKMMSESYTDAETETASAPGDNTNFQSSKARTRMTEEDFAMYGRSVMLDSSMPLEAYMPQSVADFLAPKNMSPL